MDRAKTKTLSNVQIGEPNAESPFVPISVDVGACPASAGPKYIGETNEHDVEGAGFGNPAQSSAQFDTFTFEDDSESHSDVGMIYLS